MARSPLFRNFNNRDDGSGSSQTPRSGGTQNYGMLGRILRSKIAQGIAKELGDVGSLVYNLIRPKGKSLTEDIEAEVEAATHLLEQIESGGPPQKPPSGFDRRRDMISSDNFANDDWRNPPPNEPPLIEGPILVESSNVFSIAWEHSLNGTLGGNLLVRFLAGPSTARSGPGAMYRYFGLQYSDFQAFRQAASKGGWVWDHLRLRGSLVGHQVNFEIVDVGELGRVPRQVGHKRGEANQYYLPRTLGGVRSNLPEQKIGRAPRTNLQNWDRRSTLRLRQT